VRRLRLLCWLLAWACWAWLGARLYVELPRDFGPAVSVPATRLNEGLWGFVAGRDVVLSCEGNYIAGHYRSWDARTGQLLHDWCGSTMGSFLSMKHGVVIGVKIEEPLREESDLQWSIFNLVTGRKVPFFQPVRFLNFHPVKPLAAGLAERPDNALTLVVVDLHTGMPIEGWGHVFRFQSNEQIRALRWAGDSSEVILLAETRERTPNASPNDWESHVRLERWNASGRTRSIELPRTFTDIERVADDGRILLSARMPTLDDFAVVDSSTGQLLADVADISGLNGKSPSRRVNVPVLSADGRILCTPDGVVWDIDHRRAIWIARDAFQAVEEASAETNTMFVTEHWDQLLGGWNALAPLRTQAVRDLGTGALQYRLWRWAPTFPSPSSDGRLAVVGFVGVHQLPPQVNLPLFAFCQVVLATPLVMLWCILRWRRNRRAKVA